MKYKLSNEEILEMALEECTDKWQALEDQRSSADSRQYDARRNLRDTAGYLEFLPALFIVAAAGFISAWFLLLFSVTPFIYLRLSKIFYPELSRVFNERIQESEEAHRRLNDFDLPTRRAFMAARVRELRAQR